MIINGKEKHITDGEFARFAGGTLVGGTDWNSNPYAEGDWVLYAVGAGRGQAVAYGKILKIILKNNTHSNTHLEYKVQVQTYMTSAKWGNASRTRPAYVNPMNITALTKEQQDLFNYALDQKVSRQNAN
jgi:hypothetical protein